jgi:DNA repair exonuclease SbcCD nuclease subunit
MRLVHLSDLHLGYRQYQRLTPAGINQREADIARTFKAAVDQLIAIRPDIVLVAGDVFHTSRPTNAAILHAFKQFRRIRVELPNTIVVMIAGNHDTPRTTESGSIMGLFEQIDVHVAAAEAKRFTFPDHGLSVLAVPDVPGPVPQLDPDPGATTNILLIHARVQEVVPQYYADLDRAAIDLPQRQLGVERWDYVGLGHYHVHHRVAPNAFYSGSIDYTSLNVWFDKSEEKERGLKGKSFVEFDLDSGKHTRHDIASSRELVELGPLNARGLSVAEVNEAIRRLVDRHRGGIDDKIVRLVVRDIPRQVSRELDHRVIREYKRRALSFNLDTRKPDAARRDAAGAPARRPSVTDVVREELQARDVPPDLDRGRFVDLGMKYLAEADAAPIAMAAVTTDADA